MIDHTLLDILRPPKPFPRIWKWTDVLVMTAGTFGLVWLGVEVVKNNAHILLQFETAPRAAAQLSLLGGVLETVVILGCVYFFGLRRRQLAWSDLGLFRTNRAWLRLAVVLGVAATFLSSYVATAVQRALATTNADPQGLTTVAQGLNVPTAVLMLLLSGMLVPLAEEIFFRGVIYNWLRGVAGIVPAALLSSLLFGFVHGDVSVAAMAFVLGLILALAYEVSRSLYPAIFIHAFHNSIKLALLFGLLAGGRI